MESNEGWVRVGLGIVGTNRSFVRGIIGLMDAVSAYNCYRG